jgi:hypothetical protein
VTSAAAANASVVGLVQPKSQDLVLAQIHQLSSNSNVMPR